MLEILSYTLGPVETNAYLVCDTQAEVAVVIDPAWDGEKLAREVSQRGFRLNAIWLTHAHFDHIAGAAAIVKAAQTPPAVYLHPDDLSLYHLQGGASLFGMRIDPVPEPVESLSHGQVLRVGAYEFEVRHAPGHTPGHVVFYCPTEKVVFCGDVIFYSGIGRTDLPGGSFRMLMESIHSQILSLPDDTRLLSGHGPETTVGQERADNPFL